jgi:hypothetical protein
VEFNDKGSLRDLADRMVRSPTNLLRAPGVHGELYDEKPCWIFVPICTLKFIKEWEYLQGYEVMAIAGGWEGLGRTVKVTDAYSSMCQNYYNHEGAGHFKLSRCERKDLEEATARMCDMALALAETLVGREDKISPVDLQSAGCGGSAPKPRDPKTTLLTETQEKMKEDGIVLPQLRNDIDYDSVQVLKFRIDPDKTDLVPDPMLLLMKADINWSWRCGQKVLPACGTVNTAGEEKVDVPPTTPIPSSIEFKPNPVTPETDVDDDLSF